MPSMDLRTSLPCITDVLHCITAIRVTALGVWALNPIKSPLLWSNCASAKDVLLVAVVSETSTSMGQYHLVDDDVDCVGHVDL
jgi:predicted solute-binding protein